MLSLRMTERISFWCLTVFLLTFQYVISLPHHNTIRVPGFFGPYDVSTKRAFVWAFSKLNLRPDRSLLYAPYAHDVDVRDIFQVSKRVCLELEAGGKVLFGPSSRRSCAQVQSISNFLGIPHIQYHWDPHEPTAAMQGPGMGLLTINVYPHFLKFGQAHRDLITYWQWTRFTIIYEDNDGLKKLQKLIEISSESDVRVTIRKMDSNPDSYAKMFKDIAENHETRLVIDCDARRIIPLLRKATDMNVLNEYHHYHFTTLDLPMLDLGAFKEYGANITAFTIVDPDNPVVSKIAKEWKFELFTENGFHSPFYGGTPYVSTEVAMIYDAVYLYNRAMESIQYSLTLDFKTKISCNGSASWNHGISLFNYMKTMDFQGMTGRVHFGTYGMRDEFVMNIIEVHNHAGIEKSGSWNSSGKNLEDRINITITREEIENENKERLATKKLRVVTKTDDPYVMDRERHPDGSVKYTGFVIDILDKISKNLNFTYEIVKNCNSYGGCKSQGNCEGMVKELVDLKADLAVAGMTITYDRERYIDFTKPFLNLGITILIKKPVPEDPNLFSFLLPFHEDVWIYMMAGFLCLSFLLFVIARLSPFEWKSPEPCDANGSGEVENIFGVLNSLWFAIGCLLQQGSDLAPAASSTRTVAVVWWFYSMIIISSYTANLAAFLTMSAMGTPIESITDLSKQTEVVYGTLEKGSTNSFFEFSQNVSGTYQKVWNFMQGTPGALVPSSKAGIAKVSNENYAFFAESTTIDYVVQRQCELTQVGGWLNSIGYGLAVPEGSPYRDEISREILRLRQEQEIDVLYVEYWTKRDGGGKCEKEEKADPSLKFENVAGVFLILVMGGGFALVFAAFEFLWVTRKNAIEDEQTWCSEMKETLKFILPCLGSSRKKRLSH